MPETCTMMFEVQDLKVASPATVSRCGMVYLEPVHLGWTPLVESWCERMQAQGTPGESDRVEAEIPEPFLSQLVEDVKAICTELLPAVRKQCKEMVPSVYANLVASLLKLLQTFLGSDGIDLNRNKDKLPDAKKAVLTYLAFSVVWSLGANLHGNSRATFATMARPVIKKRCPDFPDGDPFEFGIDAELHKTQPWSEQIPGF
jgi:dynein heavy chain